VEDPVAVAEGWLVEDGADELAGADGDGPSLGDPDGVAVRE
jgi:hypothetical protein